MERFHALARQAQETHDVGGRLTAVALDLMGMKSYNVQHGRAEGDQLLRMLADALRRTFGELRCSRYAEDHFYAFCSEEGVELRLANLFDDYTGGNKRHIPPLRVGLYACEADDDVVEVGFDRAKIACDLDRATWHSHYTWFTDDMRAQARLQAYLLGSLRQAVRERWVRPYYQCIVRSSTEDVCAEEALARWVDPVYGPLSPAQFVPVLEEAGLIRTLDLHIVDCVLEDFRTKRAAGTPIVPVSVNISLRDLDEVDIADEIIRRVDAAGESHDLICVEFTESVATLDLERLVRQIAKLHEAGFKVWMDDFGSGYSSLNLLQNLDFDLIKLDMGFLQSIESPKAQVIVSGVIQAAKLLGVATLTEGVEKPEHAGILADMGCGMLQGYYYSHPRSLEDVMERASWGARPREPMVERSYWDTISMIDLADPEGMGVFWDLDSQDAQSFPAAVYERRHGWWLQLRANEAYRDTLRDMGDARPLGDVSGRVAAFVGDANFNRAVQACRASGHWERITNRGLYGSRYQFAVRPLAEVGDGGPEAYLVAGMPTMLGSALGAYGDVPLAYAVLRATYDKEGTVLGTEFVYANQRYCAWTGTSLYQLTGRPFFPAIDETGRTWLSWCRQVLLQKETVHDIVFSPEVGHWISAYLAPSSIEGFFVYAFALADDERQERVKILSELNTSDLVIEMTKILNRSESFEESMQTLLEAMSQVVHPERIYIFERGETTSSNTFEWCAPGVEPMIDTLQDLDNSEFATWERLMANDDVVLIPNVEQFRDIDPQMYWQLTRQGITHLLAVPFYLDGKLQGYLGADNYELAEDVDTTRLLQTVASFIGARIVNYRLIREMEAASAHDALTGVLNRRGIDLAIAEELKAHPEACFALALMDVDDFKTLNDAHGHDVGDEALRMLAQEVSRSFPAPAIVGRNGGDEFLVFLAGPDAGSALERQVQAFMRRSLACRLHGQEHAFSVSLGMAVCPGLSCGQDADPARGAQGVSPSEAHDISAGDQPDEGRQERVQCLQTAYTQADEALYVTKLSGKAGWRRYSPDMSAENRSQLAFSPRDIANNMPGALVMHLAGADGHVIHANEEAIRLFGCQSFQELMDHVNGTYRGMIHPDDYRRVESDLMSQKVPGEAGSTSVTRFRIQTKSGETRTVSDTGRLVEFEDFGKVCFELLVEDQGPEAL
jgi:diguanylate cyclase (GGDEF)-like protein